MNLLVMVVGTSADSDHSVASSEISIQIKPSTSSMEVENLLDSIIFIHIVYVYCNNFACDTCGCLLGGFVKIGFSVQILH